MLIDELIEQHKDKKKTGWNWIKFATQELYGQWYNYFLEILKDYKKVVITEVYKQVFEKLNKYTYSPSRRATRGEEEASPALFWKSKKMPWFWKKDSDYVRPWVKFSIKNVVLRVSIGKNFKMFPVEKSTFKCPNLTKSPLPYKIFGCAPAFRTKSSSWISECCNLV